MKTRRNYYCTAGCPDLVEHAALLSGGRCPLCGHECRRIDEPLALDLRRQVRDWLATYSNDVRPLRAKADAGTASYDAYDNAYNEHLENLHRLVESAFDEKFYTLKRHDVGQPWIRCFGKTWLVSGFIGQVLTCDVGKRVFKRGEILQVENDEQRNVRRRD